jgi:hypothetical protein
VQRSSSLDANYKLCVKKRMAKAAKALSGKHLLREKCFLKFHLLACIKEPKLFDTKWPRVVSSNEAQICHAANYW